ncbi:hypothetical protein A2Z10_00755 [Candidatus Azambacteria bacterium RBG_16_47_10]|uniref:AbiTii domain-containing protein n=1 Tax=Candidatus Azambacteria bacterium RBG_16_47_10 TaxID=1797292 RepID=A0A1F5B0W7_9BACT|nr:MAG: hypothetical protein A2Z10_00755 [Candidatus Azambacteria bacterium RBG_16_47_10]
MTKIEAFIKNIQNESVSVSSLLREAKLIASGLGQSDFLKWLNLEIEGYKSDDNYPKYRSLSGQMKGWNPYYGWVPVIHKTSEIEKRLCTRSASQSIREIEELLSNKAGSYEMPYPASVSDQILEGSFKTKLSMFISRPALVGILDSVRNRLLDWAVELKRSGIHGDEVEFTSNEKKEVQKIESKFNIGKIENFHGNLGEGNNYTGEILSPAESFWMKAFWYIFIAFVIVVAGNISSAAILKYILGI